MGYNIRCTLFSIKKHRQNINNNNQPLKHKTMRSLNQTQKEFLKTITNFEDWKKLKKAFKKVNSEIAGLTDDQIYCIDNTVYTDSARKKLIKLFREENLMNNLNLSIN